MRYIYLLALHACELFQMQRQHRPAPDAKMTMTCFRTVVGRGDEDVFVVDFEARVAETLEGGRAVGEMLGGDGARYAVGLRVDFEL